MERIPVPAAAGSPPQEASHLAVRFDEPSGSGPTAAGTAPFCFLYLHGFGSQQSGEKADLFRRNALGLGIPFASFDFQGHGQSGGDLGGLTLTRNLADVRRVREWLRQRGHERICLIGSSMGGGTALWESALHPEGVVAGLHIAPALELDRSLLAWAGEEGARRWRETGSIRFKNDLVDCDLSWELIEDLQAHPLDELLVRFRTPTLLLQGKRDSSVAWRSVADFAVRCPYEGIELHLFADGDHRFLDRLDRLWDLMVEFLRGRGLL